MPRREIPAASGGPQVLRHRAPADTIAPVGMVLIDDRYELLALVGSGGMADVYLARDVVLDREVALKLLKARYAEDEEFVERFRREAKSAAALTNRHIVSVFDRGETEDGAYYIVMEYVPGGDLGDLLEGEGKPPPRRATEMALQVAEALKAAHERGVVHRDIKPRNILITRIWAREGRGLRHSAGIGGNHDLPPGRHPGQREVHVPRAGGGGTGGASERPILVRRRPLRDAHGEGPLRGQVAGRRVRRACEGATAPSERGEPGDSEGPRRRRNRATSHEPGGPLRKRGRVGERPEAGAGWYASGFLLGGCDPLRRLHRRTDDGAQPDRIWR